MFELVSINPKDYVVLDLETNGLSSKRDDILSISLYKPDDGKQYTRFLPLELASSIKTTEFNGITKKDLAGKKAISQDEYDKLVEEFELDERTILIYASLKGFDDLFLREYMRRHQLSGFEDLTFYNFKKQIVSSKFSGGNVTKDNLCIMFGIENVQKVHSGKNDCVLEWQLFTKMNGHSLFITPGEKDDNVFQFEPGYIVPVSYLESHPNIWRLLEHKPYIECESNLYKSFSVSGKGIEKFGTTFDGTIIENLIDSMLNVEFIDSKRELLENKKKLSFLGRIPSAYETIPMQLNLDGSITMIRPEDKPMEKKMNRSLEKLKEQLEPLVNCLKTEIFHDEPIKAQELVINEEDNILALCDLSTEDVVLELKTNARDSVCYKEQLFYEANGRKCYHLNLQWNFDEKTHRFDSLTFNIFSVEVKKGEPSSKRDGAHLRAQERLQETIKANNISIIKYIDSKTPIYLKCDVCGAMWEDSYHKIRKGTAKCPECFPTSQSKPKKETKPPMSNEERKELRSQRYAEKIATKSDGTIEVLEYKGSREKATVRCKMCGYQWKYRADHLLNRCYCSKCRGNGGIPNPNIAQELKAEETKKTIKSIKLIVKKD